MPLISSQLYFYKLLTIKILSLLLNIDSMGQIKCKDQHKLRPTNNCDLCFTPLNQLPVAKLLLYSIPFKENEKQIEKLINSSSSLQSIEYIKT